MKTQDPKLVAAKEQHEREVKYISKTYRVPIQMVRRAMKDAGRNGKPSRSRKMIYASLREYGYPIMVGRAKAN